MMNLQEKETSNRDKKPMKKLSKWMALFAITGMTTFLTGCGDDDGGDDGGQVIVTAPQSEGQMRALSYTLNVAGDPNAQVLIFPAQNQYQITTGGQTFTGSYSNPTFSANQLAVTLTPDNPTQDNPAGVLTMNFSQQGQAGTFAFTPTGGGTVDQGQFTWVVIDNGGTTDGGTTSGGGGPQFAPETEAGLTAQSYTVSTTEGDVTLSFPAANTYNIVSNEGTEAGAFTAARDGETWTLNLTPTGAEPDATLVMTWSAQNMGNFVYTPVGGQPESGSFTAGTGGTTNGGTTSGTTNGGGGSGNAPPNIIGAWNLDVETGPFAGDFIATYDGSNFTIVRASDSNPMGQGTYTYTPSTGNTDQATLIHNYGGDFAGDQDTYTLTFSSSTAATFSGTVVSPAGSPPRAASGTFTK